MPTSFNWISETQVIRLHRTLRSLRERLLYSRITLHVAISRIAVLYIAVLYVALFGIEQLLLGRSQSGVGVGVSVDIFRPELKSKSLEILRLLSPTCNTCKNIMFMWWLCIPWNALTWKHSTLFWPFPAFYGLYPGMKTQKVNIHKFSIDQSSLHNLKWRLGR